MNGYVHLDLTRTWALDEGFAPEVAEEIARADIGVDRVFPGRHWRYKGYHFRWLGARRHAARFLARAIEIADPTLLGMALHFEQDALSHGHVGHLFHYPGIDIWNRRSPRLRSLIERRSREMLRMYRDAVPDDWCDGPPD
jgi:hypothetical protein